MSLMKGFKFKLEGLLKLREFKENAIKSELGGILKEMTRIEQKIDAIEASIDESYKSQEEFLAKPAAGEMIRFFPYFIKGKKEDLAVQHNLMRSLKNQYQQKLLELKKARGDVKVIENMKDKKKTEFKKASNKKREADIEDILNLRRLNEQEAKS